MVITTKYWQSWLLGVRWSIEPVNGGVDSLGHPDGDRLAGENQAVVDDGTFGAAEAAEHVIDGIGFALVADADPEPGKLVGAQVSCDVTQPLLSSVGPAGPDPDLSHG